MTKKNTRRTRDTPEKSTSRISSGKLSDRSEDAWALALCGVERLPLKIQYSSHDLAEFVRRSSRFTTNNFKTPKKENESRLNALSRSELRRSTRFCSSPASAPALTLMHSMSPGSKKPCPSSADNEGEEWKGLAANVGQHGLILRRSPLLNGGRFSSVNPHLPPLTDSASASGKLSKNCFAEMSSRSRTGLAMVNSEKNGGKLSSKKCLRSSIVKVPSDNKEENTNKNSSIKKNLKRKKSCSLQESVYPSIESPEPSETRYLTTSLRRSPRVNTETCDDTTRKNKASQLKITPSQVAEDRSNASNNISTGEKDKPIECHFIGNPLPEEVAHEKWQWRYELKHKNNGRSSKLNENEEDEIILNVDCHYAQARVGSWILDIGDCVCVKGEGTKKHVGRILEFFKTMEGEDYFRVQWFFRAEDTVLKEAASSHDKKRLFYSTLTNDNLLDCIISKVKVVKVPPSLRLKPSLIRPAAYYYDMEYSVDYSSFRTFFEETTAGGHSLLLGAERLDEKLIMPCYESLQSSKKELWLLDLYSGCGGMSTGLCIGAKVSGTNLVTKWAVDQNSSACSSLRLNHPETLVRTEGAGDFLELIKQWKKLCKQYLTDLERTHKYDSEDPREAVVYPEPDKSPDEYEVLHLVDICYGDPCESGRRGLHFQVRWKGYGSSEDTWEPIKNLSNCQEKIKDFVRKGFETKLLPLPGEADVICGGPPCQGISGYNRFRNMESPLDDERNRQIVVFMDIVDFLKPKYVLMENVVDIIRLDKASLARYALSRLVGMKYQARLGTMTSGCYGLPQFRMRVFIWGAHPNETLPQFPLPTHDVIVKYWPPLEFGRNVVAYEEGQPRQIEEAVVLRDSISDLPPVTNFENREKMEYEKPPETEFQSYIRLSKDRLMGLGYDHEDETSPVLFDHRPLQLSEHDFLRICQIPHRKGANFRDLPGIIVGPDNVAQRDPKTEPVMLPTGRPLVPDCVLNYDEGRSKTPYSRLWWDETVSTVLTFPNIARQALLHPEQDRILSIRECARLQGFPDFYTFSGTIKERYQQIGNAVSVPVARALGYALGVAYRQVIGDDPLMILPPKFCYQLPEAST